MAYSKVKTREQCPANRLPETQRRRYWMGGRGHFGKKVRGLKSPKRFKELSNEDLSMFMRRGWRISIRHRIHVRA